MNHPKKIRTVPLIVFRHRGHWFRADAHWTQVTICPHGTYAMETSLSKQTLHSRASFKRRISSSSIWAIKERKFLNKYSINSPSLSRNRKIKQALTTFVFDGLFRFLANVRLQRRTSGFVHVWATGCFRNCRRFFHRFKRNQTISTNRMIRPEISHIIEIHQQCHSPSFR